MANLRLAMDAAFWDVNIASPQSLVDGAARAVPGEPVPLDGARAGRTIRPQQLAFFQNAFPFGLTPSLCPTSKKEQGSFAVQSLLLSPSLGDWWMGLIGQIRPRKLISSIKTEVANADEFDLVAIKDIAKQFLDKSLYAVGLCSQFSPNPDTSLLFSIEGHGEQDKSRSKATLIHKLTNHDITVEAAWPELFIDKNGNYWNVPSSLSFDVSSLMSDSGLRYRLGLHKNGGNPQPLNSSGDNDKIPEALMPGLYAKAAFSLERSRDLWREKEKKDVGSNSEKEMPWMSSYDERLKEPHSSVSAILGGSCAALLGGNQDKDVDSAQSQSFGKRMNPISANVFGSMCYTIQRGKFKEDFNDLTRLDVRVDFASVPAFIGGVSRILHCALKGPVESKANTLASPRLSLTLQQQVAGPIVARVDSRIAFLSEPGKHLAHVEDLIFSLSYSLRILRSGKILAWYSPKKKEAMVELRLFEF
ncbi:TRIGALACTOSYLDIACYLGLYCEROL-like protein isoform X2 [Wolffia australiana]